MKLRGAVVRADKKKCPHLEFCCEIRYNVEIESVRIYQFAPFSSTSFFHTEADFLNIAATGHAAPGTTSKITNRSATPCERRLRLTHGGMQYAGGNGRNGICQGYEQQPRAARYA
jgi:hypothetical protein